MRNSLFALLIFFGPLLLAQNDRIADPNSGIQGLKDNLNRLLNENKIDSALFYMNQLIAHYQSTGDTEEEVRAAVHKGEVLRYITALDEALDLMEKYAAQAESLENSTVKSTYYNRLAAILFEAGDKSEALKAVKKSQEIDSIKGYTWRIYSNWNIEGAIYRDQEQYQKALNVLENSARYAQSQKDTNEYLTALYNLSRHHYRVKNYAEAIATADKYLQDYPYQNHLRMPADVVEIRAYSAQAMEDFQQAFQWLDTAYNWRLKDMQQVIESRVKAMRITEDLEKARLESQALRSEQKAYKFQTIALATTLMMAILVGITLYLNSKRRHARQEEENRKMKESLEFKNQLISIVAHDIRNPVASLRGMLQLYAEGLVKTNELTDWMDGLETSVANVDLLLENLLNWVKIQSGSINPKVEKMELLALIQNTKTELKAQMDLKKIDFIGHELPEAPFWIEGDPNILAFCLRNVLSNAIKFSEDQSKIELSVKEANDTIQIAVKDYGIGMTSDQIEKLYQKDVAGKEGTKNEKGTGMGLSLCMEFLEALNGHLAISSEIGKGSTFTLVFPGRYTGI